MGPYRGGKHIRDRSPTKDDRGLDPQHCDASESALIVLGVSSEKNVFYLVQATVILGRG